MLGQNIRFWDMGQCARTMGYMPKREDPNERVVFTLLRAARQEAGMRQVDLADRLRQPQSYVSKYESGERRLDLLELRQVCSALDISLEAFVHRLESALDEG